MVGEQMSVETKARIIKIINEAKTIKSFILKLEKPINYKPGEFILTWFPNEPKIKRAYSISNYSKNNELKLTIKLVENGLFTTKIFKTKIGEELIVKGSFGALKYEGEKKIVLIAGGCGIAPFMSFLDYFKTNKCPKKVFLFYAFSNPENRIMIEKQINELNCEIKLILTCPPAGRGEVKNWSGETEYICPHLLTKYVPKPLEYNYFLCGSHKMINSIQKDLEKKGIPENKIKHEKF